MYRHYTNYTKRLGALLVLWSFLPILLLAQKVNEPPQNQQAIKVDLIEGTLSGPLPFDVPIMFSGELPTSPTFSKVTLRSYLMENKMDWDDDAKEERLKPVEIPVGDRGEWNRPASGLSSKQKNFYIPYPFPQAFYRPNKIYKLKFTATSFGTDYTTEIIGYTESSLANHLRLDIGVGYAFKPQAVLGLITLHYYPRPVNFNTNLGQKFGDNNFLRHLAMRTSVFLGVAPTVIAADVEQEIKPVTGIGNVVYGLGLRSPFYWPGKLDSGKFGRVFLQPMRLNAGFFHFAQENANPLISSKENKSSFFLSLTFDLSITEILGPLGKLFQ